MLLIYFVQVFLVLFVEICNISFVFLLQLTELLLIISLHISSLLLENLSFVFEAFPGFFQVSLKLRYLFFIFLFLSCQFILRISLLFINHSLIFILHLFQLFLFLLRQFVRLIFHILCMLLFKRFNLFKKSINFIAKLLFALSTTSQCSFQFAF